MDERQTASEVVQSAQRRKERLEAVVKAARRLVAEQQSGDFRAVTNAFLALSGALSGVDEQQEAELGKRLLEVIRLHGRECAAQDIKPLPVALTEANVLAIEAWMSQTAFPEFGLTHDEWARRGTESMIYGVPVVFI